MDAHVNIYYRGVAAFGHPAPQLTYDAQGRLVTITYSDGVTKTLTYDAQGRLSGVASARAGSTLTKTLSYDAQGRLSAIAESYAGG